jgi:hypothetical protein
LDLPSTLYQAYTQLVTSLAQISQDHVAKADAVNTQVVEALKTLEKHNDDLKKKVSVSLYIVLHHLTMDSLGDAILPETHFRSRSFSVG